MSEAEREGDLKIGDGAEISEKILLSPPLSLPQLCHRFVTDHGIEIDYACSHVHTHLIYMYLKIQEYQISFSDFIHLLYILHDFANCGLGSHTLFPRQSFHSD